MSIVGDLTSLPNDFLSEEGTPATVVRVTSSYNALTDTATLTEANVSASVVLTKRKVKNDNGESQSVTVIKSNVALKDGDRVIVAGQTYRVETVEETAPHGVAIFWSATVRK